MNIRIVKEPITSKELSEFVQEGYTGRLVKAVVDIKQGIMAVGGELHADEEVLLMGQEGAERENTWGINIYPEKSGEDFIQFDSMINLKPGLGNRSRGVENTEIQEKIRTIVSKLILK
ncbi:MAG: DUF5674 family protein [bacterium]|nr:DUF5674 family protein [bacterium]